MLKKKKAENDDKTTFLTYPTVAFHGELKAFLDAHGKRGESMNNFILDAGLEALRIRQMQEGVLPVDTNEVEGKIEQLESLLKRSKPS